MPGGAGLEKRGSFKRGAAVKAGLYRGMLCGEHDRLYRGAGLLRGIGRLLRAAARKGRGGDSPDQLKPVDH